MLDDALRGMTVVDLSQGIAGPYCASLLADFGARVIKVEPPGGDWLRLAGGTSAMFETFNRGKQSIVLDLKSPKGVASVRQLAKAVDVVVESARVGVMEGLGLGYAELKSRHPELVYTSISGFGQTGPNAFLPATDTVIQAYAGIAAHATSLPGFPRIRLAIVDLVSGLYAHQATLAALMKLWRTGKGHWVQVDLMHSMAALQAYKIADVLVNDNVGEDEAFAIIGNYMAADGAFAISGASDKHVVACLHALDLSAMLQEPAFANPAARHAHQSGLRLRMAAVLASMSLAEVIRRLRAVGVPCQRILDYKGFVAEAEVNAPSLFQSLQSAHGTSIPSVRTPATSAGRKLERAPALDEHAVRIGAEFNLECK